MTERPQERVSIPTKREVVRAIALMTDQPIGYRAGEGAHRMSEALSYPQRTALYLLATQDPGYDGEGAVSSEASDLIDRQAWVHWRTAEALQRRGLVEIGPYDSDGTGVKLTDAGREAAKTLRP